MELGTANVEHHIMALNDQAIAGLRTLGYEIVSPLGTGERSGVLAFRQPPLPVAELEQRLSAAGGHLAIRAGNLRISPSFYNDSSEIERLLAELPSTRG